MIKLFLIVALGAVAIFAADSPAAPLSAANYPYRPDPVNPYNRNNYNYDRYNRNDPYNRNDQYYRNNQYQKNNPYYNNDYYRQNDYYNRNNNYNRYDPYNNNNYNNVNYKYNTGAEAGARILSYESDVRPDGSYEYSYNTDNGISAAESGVTRYQDQENGAQSVQGFFSYTSPEGVPVSVRYVADEYGFRPEGDVLPKTGSVVGNQFAAGNPVVAAKASSS